MKGGKTSEGGGGRSEFLQGGVYFEKGVASEVLTSKKGREGKSFEGKRAISPSRRGKGLSRVRKKLQGVATCLAHNPSPKGK